MDAHRRAAAAAARKFAVLLASDIEDRAQLRTARAQLMQAWDRLTLEWKLKDAPTVALDVRHHE